MRTRTFILCLLALCLSTIRGYASGLGDFRVNARFLTDRMAFELHLNSNQYNDLYEINYDFLCNIGPYVSGIAVADTRAMDAYYRYLDERNDDLRWVLSQAEYVRFIDIEYFFRPIYAINNVCYLRVYKIYPNRTHFYFGPPRHYLTYRGGHCRSHFGGVSYYRVTILHATTIQCTAVRAESVRRCDRTTLPDHVRAIVLRRSPTGSLHLVRTGDLFQWENRIIARLSIQTTNRRHARLTILTRPQASSPRKGQPDVRK
ncbi:MAG: hypothetical protein ACM687_10315 [Bacteroidales bacterium]